MDCYVRGVATLERGWSRQLENLAVACVQNPVKTIGGFLVVCAVLFAGASQITFENSAEAVWTDPNGEPRAVQTFFETTFNSTTEFMSYVLTSTNDAPGVNIITIPFFEEAFALHEALLEQTTPTGNRDFESLCVRGPTGLCFALGGLQMWNYNYSLFNETVHNDTVLAQILTQERFPDGSVAEYEEIFGAYAVVGGLATARAMTNSYIIESFVDGSQTISNEFVDLFLEFTNFEFSSGIINPTGFAQNALDSELEASVFNDIILVIIAYNLMIVFASNTLGVPCSNARGRNLVVTADIMSLVFAAAAAYGLMMWIGVPFTALVQIGPFILLGIGIDNAYVIARAFDHTDVSLPMEERVTQTMRSAGMSVTATTLTDFGALMLGGLTRLPAVQYFCFYTGTAILFVYFEHITVFIVFLSLDAKRREAQRRDCVVCLEYTEKDKANEENRVEQDSFLTWFLYKKFGPIILDPKVRILILLFFAGIGGLSGYAITLVSRDFKLDDLVPDGSFVGDYFRINREVYGSSFPPSSPLLIIKDIDYADPANNAEITRLEQLILNSSCIQADKVDLTWHQSFHAYARSVFNASELSGDGLYYAQSDIVEQIKIFVTIGEFQRYADSFAFNSDETQILAAQAPFKHIVMDKAPVQVDCLLQMQNIYQTSSLDPLPAIFSFDYVFFDQYRIILPEMIQNLGLALAAVVVVCLFLLVHPVSVLIMTVVIMSIFLWLLACIPMWGLDLNSISAVNLVMSIGLVVDYSLHFIHSFGLQESGLGRKERTLQAMKSIGPAVFLGLFTTFLGVLPVAFATSQVFRVFFQMFLSIVIVGGIHGFFLVPVLLSLFGPDTDSMIKIVEEVKDEKAGGPNEVVADI